MLYLRKRSMEALPLSQFFSAYKCNALTRSERGRKQVVVSWVPAYCGDLHALGALEAKLPQREKCPLRLAEFVGGVFPVLKICTKEQSFPACCSIFQLDFQKRKTSNFPNNKLFRPVPGAAIMHPASVPHMYFCLARSCGNFYCDVKA